MKWEANSENAASERRKILGVDLKLNAAGDDFEITADGDLAVSEGRDCLRENIGLFMYSAMGERCRHPDWGVGIEKYVGREPLTEEKKADMIEHITTHLLRDSRIKEVNQITVELREDSHVCDISIDVTPIDEAGSLSMVFPFDLEV